MITTIEDDMDMEIEKAMQQDVDSEEVYLLDNLMNEYIEVQQQLKTLEDKKKEISAKIKEIVKDKEELHKYKNSQGNGISYYYMTRESVDKKKLVEDLGSAAEKYMKETKVQMLKVLSKDTIEKQKDFMEAKKKAEDK